MPDIIHRIEINADKEAVFSALATEHGLRGWWTNDVAMESSSGLGSVIEFRFDGGGPDMEVTALEPSRLVTWKCVAGPEEWIDTQVLKTMVNNINGNSAQAIISSVENAAALAVL